MGINIGIALGTPFVENIGGTDYTFTVLTMRDFASITEQLYGMQLKKNPNAERMHYNQLRCYLAYDPDGIAYCIWWSLQDNHKDITLEWVYSLNGDLTKLTERIVGFNVDDAQKKTTVSQ